MSPTGTVLTADRSADAYCLHVVGRGTMKDSPTAMEFVTRSLDGNDASAVIDLSHCDYLDSTFLGCLAALHQRFNKGSKRLLFAADPAKAKQLLGAVRLDRMLPLVAQPDPAVGAAVPLPSDDAAADTATLGRHIMDCHRRLAEVDGPNRAKFMMIADRMAAELARSLPS